MSHSTAKALQGRCSCGHSCSVLQELTCPDEASTPTGSAHTHRVMVTGYSVMQAHLEVEDAATDTVARALDCILLKLVFCVAWLLACPVTCNWLAPRQLEQIRYSIPTYEQCAATSTRGIHQHWGAAVLHAAAAITAM